MRQHLAVALAAIVLPLSAEAAWVTISADAGKRIEIDPASVQKEQEHRHVALGRILFEKELTDPRSAGSYKSIEALTRYDCAQRTYATLKRTWRKADGEVLREEEVKSGAEMPVRSGSLDDKLLREVCRPRSPAAAQSAAGKLAEKANEAALELRRANDALIQQQVQKELQKNVKPATLPIAAKEAATPAAAPKPAPAAKVPARRPPAPASEAAPLHARIPWAYEGEGGPDHWGKLKPEYATCASGKRQSPIDIRDGIRVDQPAIEFAWRPSQFRITDNGHTVQVAVGGSGIALLGKRYELIQFHFHRPAEERVNGKGFEMVAHFVHRADDGRLAVVAVLIEQGAENPFVQTLWNHLPLERNEDVAPPNVAIDPLQFLPADRAYYTYMGSLTTPPCTENVQWLVLKQPVQLSAEQIAIFARLYRNNARPLQPGFGRLIKESR
ncbi:carbonic anhydrase [Azospira restricta]|uniref:carbonic anhydrase n=1 Tax=Azospira restricta TaxID=404405 RepID=A0A974SQH8_9RHOO|nr:carbonic anhydrase family protein [Azospira restricta]QRJ64498.1 carbonic anhydrase family protein [Azospira restricta]